MSSKEKPTRHREAYEVGADSETMGERIALARNALGLSQGEVASKVGTRKELFAQWETDRAEPRPNKLVYLSTILGVSPTWLMSGDGEGPLAGVFETFAEMDPEDFGNYEPVADNIRHGVNLADLVDESPDVERGVIEAVKKAANSNLGVPGEHLQYIMSNSIRGK